MSKTTEFEGEQVALIITKPNGETLTNYVNQDAYALLMIMEPYILGDFRTTAIDGHDITLNIDFRGYDHDDEEEG